jgi:hypothetical protein
MDAGGRTGAVTAMLQTDLFSHVPRPAAPAGFDYWPDVLTAAEQAAVVAHLQKLSFKPYEHMGYQGFRRIAAFWRRYSPDRRELETTEPGRTAGS